MRRPATDMEKILQKAHLIKGCYPECMKNLKTQQYENKQPN